MKNINLKSRLMVIICAAMAAIMLLFTAGCGNTSAQEGESETAQITSSSDVTNHSTAKDSADGNVLGEGKTKFTFTVTKENGEETVYEIHTDKTTVGEALKELGLISGEESEYGLFVDTVDGVAVDYNTDGKYWAFYVNGAYASSGVDSTDITEGDTYSFKVE